MSGRIDREVYKKLTEMKNNGGGVLPNDGPEVNAAVVKFIFDNAYKNIRLYEAEPINDLTSMFKEVALSFKAYIYSGLPMEIVIPKSRRDLERKEGLPFVIQHVEKLENEKEGSCKNVVIKVATAEFTKTMESILGEKDNDFLSADDNKIARVSVPSKKPESDSSKHTGDVNLYSTKY